MEINFNLIVLKKTTLNQMQFFLMSNKLQRHIHHFFSFKKIRLKKVI